MQDFLTDDFKFCGVLYVPAIGSPAASFRIYLNWFRGRAFRHRCGHPLLVATSSRWKSGAGEIVLSE
jgi:hypothetical protein